MKLMYCPNCHEMKGLKLYPQRCKCRKARGWYNEGGDTVTVSKGAVLYGFCNCLRYPDRFSSVHVRECERAWLYPENWKVTRLG